MCKYEKNFELCRRIQSGDKAAEAELVLLNDGLVHSLVNRVRERHMLSHLYDYEDCCQDCYIALLDAAKRYNGFEGSFSTYAYRKMYGAVSRKWEEKYAAHLPKNLTVAYRNGKEKRSTVVGRINAVMDAVSFDDVAYVEDDDEILYEDICRDPHLPLPDEAAIDDILQENIRDILLTLTERERKVLILRYGLAGDEPMTFEKIGKRFCVQRERIRQIEAKALRKLRNSRENKFFGYGTGWDEEQARKRFAELL